jgi:DNA-binding XRE family transcriptional regulator
VHPSTGPFADLLRSHREQAGLTQRALADLSTVSARAIRDLEAGRANARNQTVCLLADGLRLQGLVRQMFIRAGVSSRRSGPDNGTFGCTVPKAVNVLLGREAEVRVMADALQSGRRRVISISGLPGTGKTRVAAEVAARVSADRGWPVLWIDSDPRTAGGTGAGFAALMRSPWSSIEARTDGVSRVRQLVGKHEAILVLDGVADIEAPMGVADMLAYCPDLRVLSTSRAPWVIAGVHATVMPPLATPGPEWDGGAPLDVLGTVPSVRLLVERCAEVRPEFALNPADAAAAVTLCRRLDGLPLALEAAAGRSRVLSLQQLAGAPVLDLLSLPVPPGPGAAAETLGELIGSCCERLDVSHRTLLRQLVNFKPPWTVADAARFLCRPLGEVVDDLNVLIGHGLVHGPHGEIGTGLHVPGLLRAFLLAGPGRGGSRARALPGARALPAARCSRVTGAGSLAPKPHIRRVVPANCRQARSIYLPIDPTKEGEGMTFNSAEALREAGLIFAPPGKAPPGLDQFLATLTKEEVDVLISTKNRLDEFLPEVMAHSQPWTSPEANQGGFDAVTLCGCGFWSGSGAVE